MKKLKAAMSRSDLSAESSVEDRKTRHDRCKISTSSEDDFPNASSATKGKKKSSAQQASEPTALALCGPPPPIPPGLISMVTTTCMYN